MKKEIYVQEICENCLQLLVNGESDHTPEELKTMEKTLQDWQKNSYIPAGLADNMEPYFSWQKCELCNSLPGTRYEYNFFDKS